MKTLIRQYHRRVTQVLTMREYLSALFPKASPKFVIEVSERKPTAANTGQINVVSMRIYVLILRLFKV
jgi:hypothetical protein